MIKSTPVKLIKTGLLSTIAILWLIEVVWGGLQLTGTVKSGHPLYDATGSFYNPGPFACFIAVMFPPGIRLVIAHNDRSKTLAGFCIITVCAVLIPSSMSRTAWVACMAGGMIALWDRLTPIFSRLTFIVKILIFATAVAAASGTFLLKKDSATGRLLMWRIGTTAIAESPLTGVGREKVAGVYGDYQEKYFLSGQATPDEANVADAPHCLFNEYLQIAVAYGVPAMILTVGLIAGAFYRAMRRKDFGMAGSVTAIAVTMTASYPLQFPVFVLMITITLIAACLPVKKSASGYIAVACTAAGGLFILNNSDSPDIEAMFRTAHRLHIDGHHEQSNDILLSLVPMSSDPMILNVIGKNYQAMGMPDSAEYYFIKACHRCPNRLYPHYLLMKLYGDTTYFNQSRLIEEAGTILDIKEKISSPASGFIRNEALDQINNRYETQQDRHI